MSRAIGRTLMTHKISLVVATKDRPDDLRRLLDSLSAQTRRPDQVVVVDASQEPVESVPSDFPELNTTYLQHWPPSAAAQRNAGIMACTPESTLIGFVDDDAAFEPGSVDKMLTFWESAATEVGGASFNIRNYKMPPGRWAKNSRLIDALGLYPRRPGGVARSGWHSVFGEVGELLQTEWLPSTAVVWRAELLVQHHFDEFFDGYSYLEDLDFSYTISRSHRLVVIPDAGYFHYASPAGRGKARQFGRVEARNRFYFVRKHHLSAARCAVALGVRFAMTVADGIAHLDTSMLARSVGNVEGVFGLFTARHSR